MSYGHENGGWVNDLQRERDELAALTRRLRNAGALVDCGCAVKVHADGSGVEVYLCSLHRAAPALLEACKAMLADVDRYQTRGGTLTENEAAHVLAMREAVALAERTAP